MCARPFVDVDEPVLMIFPDYLMPKSNNTIKKMLQSYEKNGKTVIATDEVPMDKVSGYGVIAFSDIDGGEIVKVDRFVEKPKREEAPSNLISTAYAVLSPEIWPYLENATDSVGDGEIRVADAWIKMIEDNHEIYAVKPENPGYDCGSIIGFLKATVDFGLEDEGAKTEFRSFLESRIK
jgi:UTP--glucose-1-phosphate uridylyltransferase